MVCCLAPAVAVALMVYAFRKISMAHFNPAVTIGYLVTKHMPKNLLPVYFAAEIIGAFLGSIFVKYVIGASKFWCKRTRLSFSFTSHIWC